MNKLGNKEARSSLRQNGKSFWFASLFLPRQTAEDAAQLYAFCRAMDDLADTGTAQNPGAALESVRADLKRRFSTNVVVSDFLRLADRHRIPLAAADYLIGAFIEDATTDVHLADEAQLVRYCYGVAGTVGLMMCPILGADRQRANDSAIHLGIAMQMTNIARDVLEDANHGRRYLPGSWVENLSAAQIANDHASREPVARGVQRLLDLADCYYASAALGFPSLPYRTRGAIEIAAAAYREIGIVLRENQFEWWRGRVRVSLWRKVAIATGTYAGRSSLKLLNLGANPAELSRALAGLPGTA